MPKLTHQPVIIPAEQLASLPLYQTHYVKLLAQGRLDPVGNLTIGHVEFGAIVTGIKPGKPGRTSIPQPGDMLQLLISTAGFKAAPGCKCDEMRKQMNEWGWVKCWFKQQTIVDWLTAEARRSGVTIEYKDAGLLVAAAFREMRRRKRRKRSNE